MVKELLTSAEWAARPKYESMAIIDPDGWNRANFHYSWNLELIPEQEFHRRMLLSTVITLKKETQCHD